jgi:hypothetical protein
MKLVRPEPFVDVGRVFTPVDVGCQWVFIPVDVGVGVGDLDPDPEGDELFADTLPDMSAGDARFDTGGPGKTYDDPGVYMSGS